MTHSPFILEQYRALNISAFIRLTYCFLSPLLDETECTTAANHSGHFIFYYYYYYKFADYCCAARMVCIGA